MSHVPLLAFHVDTTLPQVAADLLLVLFIVLNMTMGYRKGLLRRVVGAVGMFLGALAATYTGNALSALLGSRDIFTNAWCFISVYLLVLIMFEVLGVLYHDRLQRMVMVTFDHTTGAIAGAVLGFLEASLIFIVAIAVSNAPTTGNGVSHASAADGIRNGTLTEVIIPLEPGLHALFAPVLPTDMSNHFATGATDPRAKPSPTPSPGT